jgi:hypothetical protein
VSDLKRWSLEFSCPLAVLGTEGKNGIFKGTSNVAQENRRKPLGYITIFIDGRIILNERQEN